MKTEARKMAEKSTEVVSLVAFPLTFLLVFVKS
jgi:hypothetical protein